MATLKDIGNALNLSPATVSRALNGFPEVSEKTRVLVAETAKKMNYRPNQIAKKLVSGRSGMVGMILKPESTQATDAAFYEIMFGLSDQLARRDMDLVFHASMADEILMPYKRLVEKNTLDGFILNAPEKDDPRIAYLQEQGIPFVVHGRTENADYAYFDIDNRNLASDALNLLANLGHQRVAFLNGPRSFTFSASRLAGFKAAASHKGLVIPEFAVHHGVLTEDYGYSAALSLLSGHEGLPPTAIICASTLIAAGVYRAANDLNIPIPSKLSVIAHDDAVPQMRAVNFSPALTVTRAPFRDACAPLAKAICDLLDGAQPKDLQTIERAELIIRDSTGPAPASGETSW
ncbi:MULTISPECIES: substrate-binding domain-containing protein [Halocynthiibacter]|uniref:Substrate-binding domain-containing protein n=1 Tax=Halocynthiibacter halioticoli TaxID=2986804 RepID=A0AAE3J2T9_9RHOB|nr:MULTISPECIES: substrate-binding domain-containing protein [Halocynthiibacter]MCV6825831.1 substrate-binding domain-containing protein [Halocynthiibacter halioticoli]MCW4058832.1 substrate-binding domain-containing protein [Halocynthiibacter sp. SDUM655004]